MRPVATRTGAIASLCTDFADMPVCFAGLVIFLPGFFDANDTLFFVNIKK
jgi:hypothetical protein